MTVNLEKIFFAYIFANKKYFAVVDPHFFKNTEIEFVYRVIHDYVKKYPDAEMPTPKQIMEMVMLVDNDGLITKEILKAILTTSLDDYDEINFILPHFNTWVFKKRVNTGIVDIIEEKRALDNNDDLDSAFNSINRIKLIVEDMTKTDFINDDDLGSDFDDPHSHSQDSAKYKIRTGFSCIDNMLGGGWDRGTLNLLMASTNSGKSLWMQNLAVKAADLGHNVLYISLEMSERKVIKRLGSMRLKIPINDYDNLSIDTEFIKRKIDHLKNINSTDIFDKKIGQIVTKFWAAGTKTVEDFDNFIKKIKEKKGLEFDLIVVDYITLIATLKGTGNDNLFIKGKLLAEGLRSLAAKYNVPVLSAIQLAKEAWGNDDVTLQNIPESKAIAETCDIVLSLIRTEAMRIANVYKLKALKKRDGDMSKGNLIKIDLDPTYLLLKNDVFVDV